MDNGRIATLNGSIKLGGLLRQRLQDLQTLRRLHHHRLAQEGAWVRDIKASAHESLVGLDPYVHGKVLQINKLDQQKDLQESLHTNVNAVDQKVTASFHTVPCFSFHLVPVNIDILNFVWFELRCHCRFCIPYTVRIEARSSVNGTVM